MSLILQVITLCIIIGATIVSLCYVIFLKILTKYNKIVEHVSIQELLSMLNATIQTEFELFDKDVFSSKGAITNSNFDNYYHEMSDHIIKSLSPIFYENLTKYMTEDAIYTLIGRRVKEYLTTKIHGTT